MASALANAVHVPLYVTTAIGSPHRGLLSARNRNFPLCLVVSAGEIGEAKEG